MDSLVFKVIKWETWNGMKMLCEVCRKKLRKVVRGGIVPVTALLGMKLWGSIHKDRAKFSQVLWLVSPVLPCSRGESSHRMPKAGSARPASPRTHAAAREEVLVFEQQNTCVVFPEWSPRSACSPAAAHVTPRHFSHPRLTSRSLLLTLVTLASPHPSRAVSTNSPLLTTPNSLKSLVTLYFYTRDASLQEGVRD